MEIKPIPGVPDSEFCWQFVDGMHNRMGMSWFKYGALADAYPHKLDAIASLQLRLKVYIEGDLEKGIEPGNTEYLIDVANFAMIEFKHPKHPNAHFAPTDSDKSPGRVWAHGRVDQSVNVERYRYRNEGD